MKTDNVEKAIESFSHRRDSARIRSEVRMREIHAVIPAVQEMDKTLSRLSLDILNAAISGENVDEKVAEIKAKTAKIREDRATLLIAAGYSADYTDIKYQCEKCGDTGFVGTVMCSCLKREVSKAALEDSGLGALADTQSFESFSLDYYKGNAGTLASMNLRALKDFAENFEKSKGQNFILMGATGLGKTHLSTSVAKVVIDGGNRVVYDSASEIFDDFNAYQFRGTVSEEDIRRRYFDVDLLIIDDLGCEMTTQFTVSCLYNIVNSRMINKKSTIINTNLNEDEIRNKYADRITSRILGEYRPLLFIGEDVRSQKLLK